MNYKQACKSAHILSTVYPNVIVRLYETLRGDYWIRFDKKVVDCVDGIELTQIATYKSGQNIQD